MAVMIRFLPVYHAEMVALGEEDAMQMRRFFTVHRSQLPFSGTAMDQCIEQTVNKSCKSSGGIQGVTLNPGICFWTVYLLGARPHAAILLHGNHDLLSIFGE